MQFFEKIKSTIYICNFCKIFLTPFCEQLWTEHKHLLEHYGATSLAHFSTNKRARKNNWGKRTYFPTRASHRYYFLFANPIYQLASENICCILFGQIQVLIIQIIFATFWFVQRKMCKWRRTKTLQKSTLYSNNSCFWIKLGTVT